MKLSVLIPVYNEEMTIGELIERVARVDMGKIEMEIIVANDGSTDASAQIIEEHREMHADLIRAYSMPINLGKGAAIRLGLHYAQGQRDPGSGHRSRTRSE
jgi:glycosyltransferase involved in cell wall biosynthesis